MALRVFLIAMIVAPAFAVDHIVGDNKGWNTVVDYTVWAEGKDFHVGDSITESERLPIDLLEAEEELVSGYQTEYSAFMYTREDHNVIKVNETEFLHCTYSDATEKIWTSGFDVVALAGPGKHWYISGMDQDCSDGMKLVVTVSVAEGPSPAPMPGSSAPPPSTSAGGEVSPMKPCVWVLAVMAAYRMIMA